MFGWIFFCLDAQITRLPILINVFTFESTFSSSTPNNIWSLVVGMVIVMSLAYVCTSVQNRSETLHWVKSESAFSGCSPHRSHWSVMSGLNLQRQLFVKILFLKLEHCNDLKGLLSLMLECNLQALSQNLTDSCGVHSVKYAILSHVSVGFPCH